MGGEILGRETEGDGGTERDGRQKDRQMDQRRQETGIPRQIPRGKSREGAERSRERQKGIKDGTGRSSCVRSIRQSTVAGVSVIPVLGHRGRTGGYRPEWATG